MSTGDDETESKKKQRGPAQTGGKSSAKKVKGRGGEGKRAGVSKPVQEASVSSTEERLREGRAGRQRKLASGTPEGLDPGEAIQQWHEFAKGKGYPLVAGKRRFVSDLDRVNTCIEEEESLFAFCRWSGIRFAEGMPALQSGPPTKEGFEHFVFFPLAEASARVIKITFPGKYGRIEHTPFLYLERLALCNELFPGLDVRFHDCVRAASGDYSIVSSMQFFLGPPPTLEEIDGFLRSLGFSSYSDGSATIDYRSSAMEIVLRDCHPKNWVKTDQGILMPIDICPEIG